MGELSPFVKFVFAICNFWLIEKKKIIIKIKISLSLFRVDESHYIAFVTYIFILVKVMNLFMQ